MWCWCWCCAMCCAVLCCAVLCCVGGGGGCRQVAGGRSGNWVKEDMDIQRDTHDGDVIVMRSRSRSKSRSMSPPHTRRRRTSLSPPNKRRRAGGRGEWNRHKRYGYGRNSRNAQHSGRRGRGGGGPGGFYKRKRDFIMEQVFKDLRLSIVSLGDKDTGRPLAEDMAFTARQIDQDVVASSFSNHIKMALLDILADAGSKLPLKSAVYGTLTGLLNLTNPEVGGDIVHRIEIELNDALSFQDKSVSVEQNWIHMRLLFTLFGELVNAHVVSPSSLMDFVEDFSELLFSGGSLGSSYISYSLAHCLLIVLPGIASQLRGFEKFDNVVDLVEKFVSSKSPIPQNPLLKILNTECPGDDLIESLWNHSDGIQKEMKYVYGFEPYHSFTKLSRGKKHSISTMKPLSRPDVQEIVEKRRWIVIEERRRFSSILFHRAHPESKDQNESDILSDIDVIVLEQAVDDVLELFHKSHGIGAQQLFLIPTILFHGSSENKVVFSHMFSLPKPKFPHVYYCGVLVSMLKADTKAYGRNLGRIVNNLFQNIEDLNMENQDRFSNWFAFHLTNFGFQWPWNAWKVVLDMKYDHPKHRFIANTFVELRKLSYGDRLRTSLENYPEFLDFLPTSLDPTYDNISLPVEESLVTELMSKIHTKEPSEFVLSWIESKIQDSVIEGDMDQGDVRVKLMTYCILREGSSTFEGTFTLLQMYSDTLEELMKVADNGSAVNAECVLKIWDASYQHKIYILNRLVRLKLVDSASIIKWIFEGDQKTAFLRPDLWNCLIGLLKTKIKDYNAIIAEDKNSTPVKEESNSEKPDDMEVKEVQNCLDEAKRNVKDLFLMIFQRFGMLLMSKDFDSDSMVMQVYISRMHEIGRVFLSEIAEYLDTIETLIFSAESDATISDAISALRNLADLLQVSCSGEDASPTLSQVMLARMGARGLSVGVKPTIAQAKLMPKEYYEMSNDVLMNLAIEGDPGAHEERLARDIMFVDQCSWDAAQPLIREISEANKSGMTLATLPYRIGITVGLVGGFLSFPLVFHLDTALWFNEYFVTTDVAPLEDLETMLEVGSWTWGWMEPILGQVSFFLLTLQFARAQMLNIKAKPYTDWMLNRRARNLCSKFPMYNKDILSEFAKSDDFE